VRTFTRDGLVFDVRDDGPRGAPVVVCLHGFPQDGTAFAGVTPGLVAAGLRVLVPDQRGYSPGARPAHRSAYVLRECVQDVVALLDAAGVGRAHLVGHDWGGVVGWTLAARRPDRVASLTALSTPHPAAMVRAVLHSDQALRSLYVGAFTVPLLPERLLLADDGARLHAALLRSGLPPGRADHYTRRMREPGALTAALGWYRALPLERGYGAGTVRVPTVFGYGRRDPFFAAAAVRGTGALLHGPARVVALDAGHWLPETAAGRVTRLALTGVRGVSHPSR
jgi:pimeloyl-ACP methyl ester carboxylesterase